MRQTLKLVALASTALITAIPATMPAQSKVGTTAAQFLGISVGPRAMGMGGAYVAQASDVSSLYWNPGAVTMLGRSGVSFSNSEWLAGTRFRWLGAALNLDGSNVIGLSVTQLDYGEEEITTVAAPDGTGQYWTASDMAIGVTYARRLTDRFSIGGTAKFVSQSIANETASTITFDAGLLFVTGFNEMRLGMSITNFGGDLTLDGRDLLSRMDIDPSNAGSNKTLVGKRKTDAWPTPLFFRVGVAMEAFTSEAVSVTVAVDAVRPNDNRMTLNGGAEATVLGLLHLRAGYKSMLGASDGLFTAETAYGSEVTLEGLSMGAGVTYDIIGLGAFDVQYAYNTFGFFGNLNTISVGFTF